jgi:hypothetical protein
VDDTSAEDEEVVLEFCEGERLCVCVCVREREIMCIYIYIYVWVCEHVG